MQWSLEWRFASSLYFWKTKFMKFIFAVSCPALIISLWSQFPPFSLSASAYDASGRVADEFVHNHSEPVSLPPEGPHFMLLFQFFFLSLRQNEFNDHYSEKRSLQLQRQGPWFKKKRSMMEKKKDNEVLITAVMISGSLTEFCTFQISTFSL